MRYARPTREDDTRVIGLLFIGWASGATPVLLPPGEVIGVWQEPLAAADLRSVAQLPTHGASVRIVGGSTWTVEVHDARGAVRVVSARQPITQGDREDIAWLVSSLLQPTGTVTGWAPRAAYPRAPQPTPPPPSPSRPPAATSRPATGVSLARPTPADPTAQPTRGVPSSIEQNLAVNTPGSDAELPGSALAGAYGVAAPEPALDPDSVTAQQPPTSTSFDAARADTEVAAAMGTEMVTRDTTAADTAPTDTDTKSPAATDTAATDTAADDTTMNAELEAAQTGAWISGGAGVFFRTGADPGPAIWMAGGGHMGQWLLVGGTLGFAGPVALSSLGADPAYDGWELGGVVELVPEAPLSVGLGSGVTLLRFYSGKTEVARVRRPGASLSMGGMFTAGRVTLSPTLRVGIEVGPVGLAVSGNPTEPLGSWTVRTGLLVRRE